MKQYIIDLYGKEVIVTQNDDGTFNKPKEILDYVGIGTALKPAHEPICLARKPLDRWWKIKDNGKKIMGKIMTVAENCLKWGTGGININESRVEAKPRKTGTKATSDEATGSGNTLQGSSKNRQAEYDEQNLGRFPANLIHDGSEEVRECFPETKSGAVKNTTNNFNGSNNVNIGGGMLSPENSYGDSGNASRFFKSILYYPKASKSERNKGCEELEKGCFHPTVKPIALMEYLIKMVTKEGGIVLDPFAGSGTTLVAAKKNGYKYIGCELTEEYIPIIEARLNATEYEKELQKEVSLF